MRRQAYQAYRNQSVATASPGELTLMLYEGCLKHIRLSKSALEMERREEKNVHLQKAQQIIQELMVTLNPDVAISASMMPMYDYMYQRLIEANIQSDSEILTEVEGYVTEFRDAWKEVIHTHRKQKFGKDDRA